MVKYSGVINVGKDIYKAKCKVCEIKCAEVFLKDMSNTWGAPRCFSCLALFKGARLLADCEICIAYLNPKDGEARLTQSNSAFFLCGIHYAQWKSYNE